MIFVLLLTLSAHGYNCFLRVGRVYKPDAALTEDISRMRRDVFSSSPARAMLKRLKNRLKIRKFITTIR